MQTFEELGVSEWLQNNLLSIGIKTPTPIQAQAIPLALKGNDIIGIA